MAAMTDRLRREVEHHLDQWEAELSHIPQSLLFADIRAHLNSWIVEGRALVANLEA